MKKIKFWMWAFAAIFLLMLWACRESEGNFYDEGVSEAGKNRLLEKTIETENDSVAVYENGETEGDPKNPIKPNDR